MALQFTTSYLEDSLAILRYYKKLGEQAMAQVSDAALTAAIDAESNSIAIIVKHLSGNMRSRWTDFLASDGEKPWRNRDSEFEAPAQTRAEVLAMWESGWKAMLETLASLTDADLNGTIRIRGERHSVMQAVNRGVTHCCYHVGQIVFLAKHLASGHWTSLTIARGKSSQFNARVNAGELSQR
jgi:hypothetical protein